MTPVLKPSEIIHQLRYEFEERLKGGGFAWNKTGILQMFDLAVGATAFWYADLKHEEPPKLEEATWPNEHSRLPG